MTNQSTLFDDATPPILPVGLLYIPDFIDMENETKLIHNIDGESWLVDLKRRVQHYGYRYDYKARTVLPESRIGPLPDWLHYFALRLKERGVFSRVPDQIIVNEYQSGQGIAPHIDCVPCFGETIASLSLLSSCVMDFTHQETHEKMSLLLAPRSLLILSGDARYEWQHGIAHRKTDRFEGNIIHRTRRLSLTFRTVI